jgi:hypothetical protein
MPDIPKPLHLPTPLQPPLSAPTNRRRPPRRLRGRRWRQAGVGLAMAAGGTSILMVLMRLPDRDDTQLLVRDAVSNVIDGLGHLFLGMLQLAGVLTTVLLAVAALVLLMGGTIRVLRSLAPRSRQGSGPEEHQPTPPPLG